MAKSHLYKLGLNACFEQEAALYPGLHLARVSIQHKDSYTAMAERGEIRCELSGKMECWGRDSSDYPVVGDWVMVDRTDNNSGNAIIHYRLRRKSVLARKAAGTSQHSQLIAANIDTVFICMSLNNDFNLRRLERYLSIVWDSAATPVIVLTKADLCCDLPVKLTEVYAAAMGVDVLVTSSMDAGSYAQITKYLADGITVAFVGSSGVGKSTLINRIIGQDLLATGEIRLDDKGRHTTTRRQLIVVPTGGVVIDTPGMRELQLETADLSRSFSDIEELAKHCRFSDCTHQSEPGCAVKAAVLNGELSSARLQNYLKLQTELSYQGMNSRQREQEKLQRMFAGIGGMKQARDFIKQKNKGR